MKENTYRIYYKNGNTLDCKAYDMEFKDGKLYQSVKAGLYNDAPKISIKETPLIDRVELIENNNYTSVKLEWVARFGQNKGQKVSSWFQFADSEIDRLKAEYNAVEVDRV